MLTHCKSGSVLFTTFLLAVFLCLGLPSTAVSAQTQATRVATNIPSSQTPVYYAILGYFDAIAYQHLLKNHFHRVLDQLNIPRDSALKGVLTQFTLKLREVTSNEVDLEAHINTPATYEQKQSAAIKAEVKAVKQLYDALLDAVAAEGVSAEEVHEAIVRHGRDTITITLVGPHGDAFLSSGHREALRLFEPSTTNAWLQPDPVDLERD